MTAPEPDIRTGPEVEPEFAWSWFQYHASQRLTSFNFFLVIIGLLLVGYAQAVDHSWNGFGVALGMLGALVAAGFLALDVRNDELVQCGLVALEGLRGSAKLIGENRQRQQLPAAFGTGRWGRWSYRGIEKMRAVPLLGHRFVLRAVICAVGTGFVGAAIWAGCGFS